MSSSPPSEDFADQSAPTWDDLFFPFGESDLSSSKPPKRITRPRSARKREKQDKKSSESPVMVTLRRQRKSFDSAVTELSGSRTMRAPRRHEGPSQRTGSVKSTSSKGPRDDRGDIIQKGRKSLGPASFRKGHDSSSNWSAGTQSTAEMTNSASTFGSLSPFVSPGTRQYSLEDLREAALEEFGFHIRKPLSSARTSNPSESGSADKSDEQKVAYPTLRPLRRTKSADGVERPRCSARSSQASTQVSSAIPRRVRSSHRRSKSVTTGPLVLHEGQLRNGRRSSVQRSRSSEDVGSSHPSGRRNSTVRLSLSARRSERRESLDKLPHDVPRKVNQDVKSDESQGECYGTDELVGQRAVARSCGGKKSAQPSLKDLFASSVEDIDVFDLLSEAPDTEG